jgi:WD40 repeat protein
MDGETITLNAEAQGEVLQAFSEALQREVHNLTPHPDLLWQQMYNRLQWDAISNQSEIKSILNAEYSKHVREGAKPWIMLKTPHEDNRMFSIRTDVGFFICNHRFSLEDIQSWHEKYEPSIKSMIKTCGFSPIMVEPTNVSGQFLIYKRLTYRDETMPCLVDISSGKVVFDYDYLVENWYQVSCYAVSMDGHLFAVGHKDGRFQIFHNEEEIWSIELVSKFKHALYEPEVISCAFSMDGSICAFSDNNHTCHFFDVEKRRLIKSLRKSPFKDGIKDVTEEFISNGFVFDGSSSGLFVQGWSPNGEIVALRNTLLWWKENREVEIPHGNAVFNKSSNQILLTGYNFIDLYDTRTGKLIHRFETMANKCVFLENEEHMALWNRKTGIIAVLNLSQPNQKISHHDLLKHAFEIKSLVSRTTKPLIASLSDSELKITNYLKSETTNKSGNFLNVIIQWGKKDHLIVTTERASDTPELWLLDKNCKDIQAPFKLPKLHQPGAIAINPLNGSIATASGRDGTVRIWRGNGLFNKKLKEVYRLHGYISSVNPWGFEYTPDGQCVALSCDDKLIIWDLNTCKVIYWDKFTVKNHFSRGKRKYLYCHFYKNTPVMLTSKAEVGQFERIDLNKMETSTVQLDGNYPIFSNEDAYIALFSRNLINIYAAKDFDLFGRFISTEVISSATWLNENNLAVGYETGAIDFLEIKNTPNINSASIGKFSWTKPIASLGRKPAFEYEPLSYGPGEGHSGHWFRVIPGPPVDREFICLRCGEKYDWPEPTTSCPYCGYIG